MSAHTISYFIAGIFAILVMNYGELFGKDSLAFMRPTDSAWVAAGPGLQIGRGILIALVLYPFLSIFTDTKNGWAKFGLLTFGMSYILTLTAAIGSYEGVIYTNLPLKMHLLGLPEISLYVILFSSFMAVWYKKNTRGFDIFSIIVLILIVLMSFMGTISALGYFPKQ